MSRAGLAIAPTSPQVVYAIWYRHSASVYESANGGATWRPSGLRQVSNADGYGSSLAKLRRNDANNDHQYSLWEHHSNTFLIASETMLMKKAFYIHQNPVAEGLVEDGAEYVYSSFRFWSLRPLLDQEPIEVDLRDLNWRQSR